MQQYPSSDDWAGERGTRWRDDSAAYEAMLAPLDPPLIAAAGLDGALTVADVACGAGGTTLALAAAAPPGCNVEGFDISADLIAAARARAGAVRFAVADVASHVPEQPYDRLVSRLGTMFFPDPAAAFTNLARWLRHGGRFAFAVWASPRDNPWLWAVREEVAAVVDVPRPEPDAPGPFRYGDPAPMLALLGAAGFTGIEVADLGLDLAVGGGLPAAEAARWSIAATPFGDLLTSAAPEMAATVATRLTALYREHERGGRVWQAARVHLVTGGRG